MFQEEQKTEFLTAGIAVFRLIPVEQLPSPVTLTGRSCAARLAEIEIHSAYFVARVLHFIFGEKK